MNPDVLERIFDGSIKPRDIKLSTLERITGNFSEDQKIGEGGFGTVYKGVLRNGEVAVKRIRNNYTIDEKLFRREVDSLLNVSHKNIVRFLGFCSNTEHKAIEYEGSRQHIYAETRERILCFEYINNGSLERYVADELRGLQWDTRYFIIKGICEGLQYLHMEMHIVHMDLKPANILIDYGMVAKITDFGLSRMEENSQTKSTNRTFSLGYTAPEYLHNGKMSVKSDVYSLGIIIIELVTGHRSIPDNDINNVLRRWRHTLRKSGEELPFRYQQITKLIEIGLLCQEEDPCKRPFINEIINGMNKLESMEREISNLSKSTVGQISAYSEDDMLGIEPLELRFPFELNNQISCSLELTNETNSSIAFSIQTTIPLPYRIQPNKGIVSPRSKYSIDITLQPIEKAPQDKLPGDFIVRSTKVKDHLKSEDITEDIFKKEEGKLVDEVNLTVTYKAEIPQLDESLRSPIISDTRNLHGPQESTVPQTKEDSVTSDEVIQFDPPKICFPLVPDKKVLSSIKIINTTESYVSVCFSWSKENTANYYFDNCTLLLPPRSKDNLVTVTRLKKEDEVKDIQFNDEIRAWYAIVDEDIKPSDLDWEDYIEWKNLPIVLTKMAGGTRGVGNALKHGMKAVQATVWRMKFLMLVWSIALCLYQAHDSLRTVLQIAPAALWATCVCADIAREWAWRVMILIWPQWILSLLLREERSIGEYAKKYKLTGKHKKRKGGSIIFCSKYGIGVWRGFIDVIISANNRNKSWGGSFSLHDLRMSGHRCRIKIDPTCEGTYANLLLDLSQLAQLLIASFCPSGVPDKYIRLLYEDMTKAGSLSPIPTKLQLFKFLKNHPALKPPRQLTIFTSELFKAYKMLGPAERQKFDTIVSAVNVDNWVIRTISTQDKLLNKVLTYKRKNPHNTVSSYTPTSENLFRFLRNFQEHGGDHDRITKAQILFNMKELEFIATFEYYSFIRGLIFELIVRTDMKGLMLEYAWENYTEY